MKQLDTILLISCRLTIATLVVVSPWYLGGVIPSTQVLMQYAILAAGIVLSIRLLATRSPTLATDFVRIPVSVFPLIGLLLLGAAQCWLPSIEPHGAAEAFDGLSLSRIQPDRLSVYPHATQIEMVRLAAVIAVFTVVACCFTTIRSQRWMVILIALNGVALAFFGLIQKLTWNGKLYWTIELTQGGTPFSTYVNRNNAAGYLNLALACAVGMLYAASQQMKFGNRGIVQRITQFVGQLNERFLLSLIACCVIFVGLLFSLSRGGLVAAVLAIIVTLFITTRDRSRWSLLLSVGGVALCLLLSYLFLSWLDPDSHLEERFKSAVTQDVQNVSLNGRIRHWAIAIDTGLDHLIAGTGFGTHRYAHLAYHRELFEFWAVNADNQFVELFVEGGLTGIVLILIEFWLLWLAIRRVKRSDTHDPIAVIAVFALVSQIVLACFDFGIILPANAITAATVFGMLVARDLSLQRRGGRDSPGFPGMTVLLVSLTVMVGLGLEQLQGVAIAAPLQRSIDRFLDSKEPWKQTVRESDSLIRQASAALKNDTDNAELHVSLGELWLNRYRQQAYAKLDESETDSRYTPQDIWDSTSTTLIHLIAIRERLAGRFESLSNIRSLPEISNNLVPAISNFRSAARLCPVLINVDMHIARLGIVTDRDGESTEILLAGVSKSPADMSVLFAAGLIAFHEENDDIAFALWKRYLKMLPQATMNISTHNRHLAAIFDAVVTRHTFDMAIERVMPDDGVFYARFLQSPSAEKYPKYVPKICEKMLRALDANADEDSGEWHFLRATALRQLQRDEEAIDAYRQSFLDDENLVARRLQLVRYLQALGRLDDAFEEATICQSLAPADPNVEKVVKEILRERNR